MRCPCVRWVGVLFCSVLFCSVHLTARTSLDDDDMCSSHHPSSSYSLTFGFNDTVCPAAPLFHPRFSPPQVSGPNLPIRLAFTPLRQPLSTTVNPSQFQATVVGPIPWTIILGASPVWLCPSMCCFLWCSVHLSAIVLWCSILFAWSIVAARILAGYCTLLQLSSVPFWLITVSTVFT